jgi:non-ribosomal peptide synthetase component F
LDLDPNLIAGLTRLARDRRVTLFALMFAAYGVLLRAHSGRDALGVMTFGANRASSKLEPVIGSLSSAYMIGLSIEAHMRFEVLVAQARDRVMESRIHQELPTLLLHLHLDAKTGAAARRVRPITLEMRRHNPIGCPSGLTIVRRPLPPRSEMEGGLRVLITELSSGDFTLWAIYRRAWLDSPAIARFLNDFVRVLEQVVLDPSCSVSELTASIDVRRKSEVS